MIAMRGVGRRQWRKLWLKRSNWHFRFFRPWFNFFGRDFYHPIPPPPLQTQDPSIRNIVSSSNIFENSQKVWRRHTITNLSIRRFWGGRMGDKNWDWKKLKMSARHWKNVFWPEARRMDTQTQSTKKFPCFLYAKSFQTTKLASFFLRFTDI